MGQWFNLGLGVQTLALELVDGKFIDHQSYSVQVDADWFLDLL